MAKSIKLKNNMYWDTKSIVHNKKVLADMLYPVGSVYLSVNNTNPTNIFGGTWKQILGNFLLTVDPNTSMAHKNSKVIGGSWNSGDTTLTIDQIPSHSHSIKHSGNYYNVMADTGQTGQWGATIDQVSSNKYTAQPSPPTADNTGGGQPHNHSVTPPFFTVYAWYRIS